MRIAVVCSVMLLVHLLGTGIRLHASPAISADADNGVLDCARQSGSDAGQKISACIDALPSGGGIADARRLNGPQTISHSLVFGKSGTVLLLGAGSTFTLADGVTLDITASNVRIEGTGTTSVIHLGNGSALRVGRSDQPVWGWRLERLLLEPAPGKQPSTGVILNNAREGILYETSVSGFLGPAIDVGNNCWSDRSIDSRVVKNGIGYNFHGTNLNAWNIRGGFINSNRVGINFDLGTGSLQGFSITDGTQMEANTDTGIRLASGVMQGILLSNIYSEIFESQRLIKTEAVAAALKVNLLSITNAYVYSKDTPPIFLGTGLRDVVNASISGLIVRHSQRELPVAETSGGNTSVTLSECASTSATGAFSETLLINHGGAHTVTLQGGIPRR